MVDGPEEKEHRLNRPSARDTRVHEHEHGYRTSRESNTQERVEPEKGCGVEARRVFSNHGGCIKCLIPGI